MAPVPAIAVVGLREFRRDLKALEEPKGWSRQLGTAHREVGKFTAEKARGEALSLGGPQRHFASHIVGRGSVTGARVALRGSKPLSAAAFWGAKKRTGWNAPNTNSALQHPAWIGATWRTGVRGEGPYALNDAVANNLPEIESRYMDAVEALMGRAFPDRRIGG